MLFEVNGPIKLAEEMKKLSEEMLNLKDKKCFINLTTVLEQDEYTVENFIELIKAMRASISG